MKSKIKCITISTITMGVLICTLNTVLKKRKARNKIYKLINDLY
ncbi:hypothetical protein EZN00_00954 [Clostridium tyrobutyricum]|nr:hypothetical protein EZN00_00954 [Clostridium tyrobutyricum]